MDDSLTKIGLSKGADIEGEQEVTVQGTFDEVIDQIFPMNPPTSTLAQRVNFTYTREDGKRIMIHNNLITWVLEL